MWLAEAASAGGGSNLWGFLSVLAGVLGTLLTGGVVARRRQRRNATPPEARIARMATSTASNGPLMKLVDSLVKQQLDGVERERADWRERESDMRARIAALEVDRDATYHPRPRPRPYPGGRGE